MWWNDYVGIPFVERGRDMSGFDCWGLVLGSYNKERGIKLPGYEWVYHNVDKDCKDISAAIVEQSAAYWEQTTKAGSREFDLVIIRMRGLPMHIGIVTKPGYMLHCIEGSGTVHERYDSAKWEHRIVGFVRYARCI